MDSSSRTELGTSRAVVLLRTTRPSKPELIDLLGDPPRYTGAIVTFAVDWAVDQAACCAGMPIETVDVVTPVGD